MRDWYVRPDGVICIELRPNVAVSLEVAVRESWVSHAQARAIRQWAAPELEHLQAEDGR